MNGVEHMQLGTAGVQSDQWIGFVADMMPGVKVQEVYPRTDLLPHWTNSCHCGERTETFRVANGATVYFRIVHTNLWTGKQWLDVPS